jgi:putative NIF3 family GTP cyclohydrolase 1 type 2
VSVAEIAMRLKEFLRIPGLHIVGEDSAAIKTAAVACGSGGSFLEHVIRHDIQLLVTGEATFHTCLEAQASGVALLLPGHFASERFAVEQLAEVIGKQFPKLAVWACERETDPLRWC